MSYTSEDMGNGFHKIKTTIHGAETVFNVCVASEDQLDEVVAFRINELENPNQEPKITYVQKRLSEYPPIAEQLDKMFHDGFDAWKAEIQAIKDKYPK